MIRFDLSIFPEVGRWFFQMFKELYQSFSFDFGEFSINGWSFLIGLAIVCLVIWFLGQVLHQ